jgi:hypothetical protein
MEIRFFRPEDTDSLADLLQEMSRHYLTRRPACWNTQGQISPTTASQRGDFRVCKRAYRGGADACVQADP